MDKFVTKRNRSDAVNDGQDNVVSKNVVTVSVRAEIHAEPSAPVRKKLKEMPLPVRTERYEFLRWRNTRYYCIGESCVFRKIRQF